MNRLPDRVDGSLALAAAGSLVLFVSVFLDWYEPGLSALNVFEITDLLLLAGAIGGLVLAARAATVEPGYEDPSTDHLLAVGVGAFLLVVFLVVDNPPAAAGRGVEAGAWLGLIGSLAMASGAILHRSRASLVLTLRPRERDAAEDRPAPPVASPNDPATGEEDVVGVEPYEPAPAAQPGAAAETEIEPPHAAPRPSAASSPRPDPDAEGAPHHEDPLLGEGLTEQQPAPGDDAQGTPPRER